VKLFFKNGQDYVFYFFSIHQNYIKKYFEKSTNFINGFEHVAKKKKKKLKK